MRYDIVRSIMKVIANMLNTISIFTFSYRLFNRREPSPMNRSQFSMWLAGFIDGEGNFQVFLDGHYLRVMFRIRLHKDDIKLLLPFCIRHKVLNQRHILR